MGLPAAPVADAGSRTAPPARRFYRWWVVFMLWSVCFLNYGDRQAIFSIFPKLKEEFRFNPIELGLIGSAFMWVYALGAPLAGYVGDRVRRKDLILGGCLFWSVITATTGFCSTLWQFVAVRALEGFGETFYFPASMSVLSDYHGGTTRSKAMAFHQSSVYAGTIAGSWFAAWLAEHYGWRTGFYLFGGAGILLAIILYRYLHEPRRGVAERVHRSQEAVTPCSVGETVTIMFRKPTVLLLLAAFLGSNFVAMIFLTWTPTFLVEKFHYQLAAAGLTGSVYIHLGSAASVPFGGMLADYLARRFPGGRMLVQAAGLLLGSVFVYLVGTTDSVSTLLTAMTLFGLCKGLYDANIFASLFDCVEPRVRATAAGIMNTVGWGGGALGPLVVGWLAARGPYATEVENMSQAIGGTFVIYITAACLLLLAALKFAPRDVVGNTNNAGREAS
jgi:MFS family permease